MLEAACFPDRADFQRFLARFGREKRLNSHQYSAAMLLYDEADLGERSAVGLIRDLCFVFATTRDGLRGMTAEIAANPEFRASVQASAPTFIPPAVTPASFRKSRRFMVVAAIGLAVAILGGIFGAFRDVFTASPSPTLMSDLAPSETVISEIGAAMAPRELLRLEGHSIRSAAFSPDGTRIVTASADNTARVWDAASGVELLRLEAGGVDGLRDLGTVWSAAFSPDGGRIVTTDSTAEAARVWDANTGAELLRLAGVRSGMKSVAFSPDGSRIVTASDDTTARIWDASTGEEIRSLRGHEHWVKSVDFSPDGTRIVTAARDRTARVWDAASGAELRRLNGHDEWLVSAEFSPDGTRIITAARDGTARVWDAASGTELRRLEVSKYGLESVDFSPDGTRFVFATYDGTVQVWDAAGGTELLRLEGHYESVVSAEFSPNGARIVTAALNGPARVWDAVTAGYAVRTILVPDPRASATDLWWQRLGVAAPAGVFVLWFLFRGRRRQLNINRGKNRSRDAAEHALSWRDEATGHLFRSDSFDRAVRDLRRHLEVPTNALDPRKTIAKTIPAGGRFRPVYGMRKVLPEHLIFIEERSSNDHLASLFDLGVHRVAQDQVLVRVFRFFGDLRSFAERDSSGRRVPVSGGAQALSGYRPTQRILVISSSSALIDRFNLQPADWIEQYETWANRTVFDTAAGREPTWVDHHLDLAERGWSLGGAQEKAFEAYAEKAFGGSLEPQFISGEVAADAKSSRQRSAAQYGRKMATPGEQQLEPDIALSADEKARLLSLIPDYNSTFDEIAFALLNSDSSLYSAIVDLKNQGDSTQVRLQNALEVAEQLGRMRAFLDGLRRADLGFELENFSSEFLDRRLSVKEPISKTKVPEKNSQ